MIDAGLYIAYVLFFIAAGAAIIFPIIYVIQDPKGVIKSVAGVAGLVAIFVLGYVLSSDEVTARYATYGVGAGSSKLIGAGLIMFYLTLIIAVVGVIFSEISKALK
jgi:hypothetical protein